MRFVLSLSSESMVVAEPIDQSVGRGTVALTDPAPILTEMTVQEEATDSTL